MVENDKMNNSEIDISPEAKASLRRINRRKRDNGEPAPQFSPDDNISQIMPRIKNAIEKTIISRWKTHCTDTEEEEAKCLEDYFINGLSKAVLEKKYKVTRTAIEQKIDRFKEQCFNAKEEKYPSFTPHFVEELTNVRNEILYSTLEVLQERLGIKENEDIDRFLYFLNVAILKETFSFIVPTGDVGKYRKPIRGIIQDIKNCFRYYDKANLIYRIPVIEHPNDWELRDKLITSLCESWIEIDQVELENGKIRLETNFLPTTNLKQARIIYDNEYPITKKEVDSIYRKIFKTEPESLRVTFLKDNNFHSSGNYWQYAKTPPDLQKEIENFVIEKNFAVKFNDVFYFVRSLNIPFEESTVRTYLQGICRKSTTDIYCHKKHLKEFPGLRFPKEQNVGQENMLVNAIWDYLKISGSMPIKDLKKWAKQYLKENDLNERVANQVITEFCSNEHRVFINEDGIIKNNPDFPEDNLKYVGKGLAKEKYAPFIVPLTVNELRKRDNNEISLSELHKILSSSSFDKKGPTRKQTETILRAEPELFKVENVNNILMISLVGKVQNEENYEVDDMVKNVGDEPILRVSTEQRPNLSPAITFDWNKITAEMKRELWFLKTPAWGGATFNLDEAISLFRYVLEHSTNENLSTRIPQDLYEDWFYNTSKWDKKRYILDLVLNYESLLKEIKPLIKDEKLNGLMEITTQYFPEITSLLRSNENTGVVKTIKDLSKKRNMLAHGTPLEMTRVQEATTIINFVGLYVYTIYTDGKLSQ